MSLSIKNFWNDVTQGIDKIKGVEDQFEGITHGEGFTVHTDNKIDVSPETKHTITNWLLGGGVVLLLIFLISKLFK